MQIFVHSNYLYWTVYWFEILLRQVLGSRAFAKSAIYFLGIFQCLGRQKTACEMANHANAFESFGIVPAHANPVPKIRRGRRLPANSDSALPHFQNGPAVCIENWPIPRTRPFISPAHVGTFLLAGKMRDAFGNI